MGLAASRPEWNGISNAAGEIELSFRYFPSTVDYTISLESSPDLENWAPEAGGSISESPNGDGSITRTRSLSIAGGSRFFHAVVSPKLNE